MQRRVPRTACETQHARARRSPVRRLAAGVSDYAERVSDGVDRGYVDGPRTTVTGDAARVPRRSQETEPLRGPGAPRCTGGDELMAGGAVSGNVERRMRSDICRGCAASTYHPNGDASAGSRQEKRRFRFRVCVRFGVCHRSAEPARARLAPRCTGRRTNGAVHPARSAASLGIPGVGTALPNWRMEATPLRPTVCGLSGDQRLDLRRRIAGHVLVAAVGTEKGPTHNRNPRIHRSRVADHFPGTRTPQEQVRCALHLLAQGPAAHRLSRVARQGSTRVGLPCPY